MEARSDAATVAPTTQEERLKAGEGHNEWASAVAAWDAAEQELDGL